MFGQPKDTVELANGVLLHRTTIGEVVAVSPIPDPRGKTEMGIASHDAALWLFYAAKGEWPKPPTLGDPEALERHRVAMVEAAQKKAENMTVTMSDGRKAILIPVSDG